MLVSLTDSEASRPLTPMNQQSYHTNPMLLLIEATTPILALRLGTRSYSNYAPPSVSPISPKSDHTHFMEGMVLSSDGQFTHSDS